MADNTIMKTSTGAKRVWEEPRIVLERVLEGKAQGGPGKDSSAGAPSAPSAPSGFLGPLSVSGGTCV